MELKVVESVHGCRLKLYKRRLLKLNFSDVLLKKKDWIRKQSVLHQAEHHKVYQSEEGCYTEDEEEAEEEDEEEEEEEEMSNSGSSASTTSNTRLNVKHFPPKLRELVPGNTVAVEVLCTDSKVTIVWQDGTEEKDIPTTLLNCFPFFYDYELFPGDWVISHGRTEKYGAVQRVNYMERTAIVKWFTHNEGNEESQLVSTNEMSVYDLKKHPEYVFRPGRVVKQIPIENKRFGTVLDSCPEGFVIVQWVNGEQGNCWPQNLKLIQTFEDEDSITNNEDSAQMSWETGGAFIFVKLMSMIKVCMNWVYAGLISLTGGPQTMTKESDALPVSSTPLTSLPATQEDSFCLLNPLKINISVISSENEVFTILDEVHFSHRFYSSKFQPTNKQKFIKTAAKEFKVLKESLPPGVWVRSYGNRMELLSVMIEGPKNTPYEDGLFLFDLQLSQDYPRSPPLCHYISYRTWLGTGIEVWSTNSTLLQLIVSIQGLILVAEPYFNEAGYEKQMNSPKGYQNSRIYNALLILKLVKSMTELALAPPLVFAKEIIAYYTTHEEKICNRLESWCDDSNPLKLEFPLLPVSKGLKLSLTFALKSFKDVLKKTNSASNAQSLPL